MSNTSSPAGTAGVTNPTTWRWHCHQCNLHKGTNLASFDPDTSEIVRLFHPRRDRWIDHFRFEGSAIVGLTPCGRTTVWLLQMNTPERLELRRALLDLGELD